MGEENFNRFASEKVIPVNGDLIIEGLGMSDEDRLMITEQCEIKIPYVKEKESKSRSLLLKAFGALMLVPLLLFSPGKTDLFLLSLFFFSSLV